MYNIECLLHIIYVFYDPFGDYVILVNTEYR